MNPDIRVEERRYLGEVAADRRFLEERKGWKERGEPMPLAFFDNPLLVPFSQKGLQNSFLRATVDLVQFVTRLPRAAGRVRRPQLFARPDLAARPFRRAHGRAVRPGSTTRRCCARSNRVGVGQPDVFFLFADAAGLQDFDRPGDRRFDSRILLSADDRGLGTGQARHPELGLRRRSARGDGRHCPSRMRRRAWLPLRSGERGPRRGYFDRRPRSLL